jgi:predicted ATPase
MLSFDELCGKPLAAADYVALAGRFHSVAISGVPRVTPANRPAAYRFMILIDVLYEQRWVAFPECTCALYASENALGFS